jgi:hypothetical protein
VISHIFDAEAMFDRVELREDDNYCMDRGGIEDLMKALVQRNAQPDKTKIDISFSASLEAPDDEASGQRCPDVALRYKLHASADDVLDADGVAELLKFMTPHAYDPEQMEQVIANLADEKKLLTMMSRDRQKRKCTREQSKV